MNPKLRGKPVIVVPVMAESTSAIAASVEAKKLGIKTNTGVADARRIYPKIQIVLARPELYTRMHHKIVEAVESCLPVESVLSVDEMACRLTGRQMKVETATEIAENIKKAIRASAGEYMSCSIGLAPNAFLAKVASDLKKPNGLTVITKDKIIETLSPLSIRELPGIGPRMEARLNREGIFKISDLYPKSRDQMRGLWGSIIGERFFEWIRGGEPRVPKHKNRSIGHEHVLDPKLRNTEGGLTVLKKLISKASIRLRKEGYFAKSMAISVRFIHSLGYWERGAKFDETQDTWVFLQALEDLWKDYPKTPPFKVGVVFYDLVKEDQHQMSLFGDPKRSELSQKMDEINSRFGKEAVTFASLHELREAAPTRISFNRIPKLDEF